MARPIDKRERNEMTKENFFRYYNKLIGCDAYLIFFEYKKNIYAYKCNHIDKNWTHKAHEATKKGGWMKFKMDMKVEHKQKILPKSTMVMTLKEFEQLPYSNKGRKCGSHPWEACPRSPQAVSPHLLRWMRIFSRNLRQSELQIRVQRDRTCSLRKLRDAQGIRAHRAILP